MDKLNQLPSWQLGVAWVVIAALGTLGFYFLYYTDADEQRTQAQGSVAKAKTALDEMRKRLENFELEMSQQKEREKEIAAAKEKLPLGSSTVDHLIRTFNQQGRLVGMNIESWQPGGEKKLDFYAKMPVAVKAQGTWHQTGEFFRRIAELDQIVNIEGLQLKSGRDLSETGHPMLTIEFEANAFRFLSDAERKAGTGKTKKKKSRRDKKKKG
jgi:type IV pilus assembly protein PilO